MPALHGIENIQKVSKLLFKIGKQIETNVNENHTILQILSSYSDEIMEVVAIYGSFAKLKEEFQDLDADEIQEWIAWAKVEFDLDNDKAERLFETIIVWIGASVDLGLSIKDIVKK